MKVAYFVNQYPQVSHTFIRREIKALERQGVEVLRFALRGWDAEVRGAEDEQERRATRHVLARGWAGPLGDSVLMLLRRPGAAWRALRAAWGMSRGGDRPWPYHLAYFAEACTLARWMAAAGVEHLHAHFGTNSAEVAMLARMLGGPRYSFTVHGPAEFDGPRFLHLDEKVRHAEFVVAISSYGRSQLWRWLPAIDWPKVEVVHCALEPSFFATPDRLTVNESPRLINIGRLCAQKGQLLLIEAAAQLVREGLDFQLVLAGDGEMRQPIEEAIRRHGIEDVVRITGWVSSEVVREELLAARALVLPSFAEGLPVVVMEAMAVGRPVLTTRIAGIPELIRDGVEGWLVPPGSLDDLAAAMRTCLSADRSTLQRMGDAALRRVSERHHADVEASKLLVQFRRCAQRP